MSASLRSAEALKAPLPPPVESPPLCVDLDGTLVLTDPQLESLIMLIKRNPFYLIVAPCWLLRGRTVLKAEVAARVTLTPGALPFDQELLAWITTERNAGRRIWLCTSSHELLGTAIASHLGLFDGVLGSDSRANLVGEARAAQLVRRFGLCGFDYCGEAPQDLVIWKKAHAAAIVRGSRKLEKEVARYTPVFRTFPARTSKVRALLRALRPHQWAKNGLLLLPLLAAHRANDLFTAIAGLHAVIAFSLCASSVYLLNDLLDLEADRANPRKATRPFAAGHLSLRIGCVLAPALLCLAFVVALFLPSAFAVSLAIYYVLTLAYSFGLKGLVVIDAIALATLYTIRIVAGAAAVDMALSFWMLLFSVFLFLSLALTKRFAELDALRRRNQLRAIGRGYEVSDLPVLQGLGTSAGYLSVLVMALYINSPEIESLYHRPRVIWALCALLLFWISRVWMLAQRGEMHDDPVVFALKDRVSLGVGVLVMLTVLVAL